jgi:glycosyltransferase involved in cell wall biosynthesis
LTPSDVAAQQPIVTCIMPTHNRRAFVPRAVAWFLRQTYPNAELIVVDDGSDPVGDLLHADERIRYVRLSHKTSLGIKRNLACEQARGDIIAHWDDDDWHAPHRLAYQVEALLSANAEVCGINRLLFYDVGIGKAWRYTYPAWQRLWLSGSSLCFTRAFWIGHRFPPLDLGEDAKFVWSGQPEHMAVLPDNTFHVGIIHGGNVSPKRTIGAYWQPYMVDEIARLVGDDWESLCQLPLSPSARLRLP